ncbi:MAG: DUF4430 domain-containing protein [Oscillospiraceae bacterium]|nr:DUF4430 domain-containing protein [Oscillospiraceae bacterium]
MKRARNICIPAAGLLASEVLLSSLRLLFAVPASAAETPAQKYAAEILSAECGSQSVQEWADHTLTSRIGMSSPDWYIMALAADYNMNLTCYADALKTYLSQNSVPSASTRERLALALAACEPDIPAVCTELLDSSASEMGIMSRIFGLHLLNAGVPSGKYTNAQLAEELIALQAPDGGWSLQGGRGDADVTAMTLQALAPYRSEPEVSAAVQSGIDFLANTQLPSGAYQSYGAENPESTAQVWLALCCLDIDPLTDSRFLPGGHSLLDGILQFRIVPGQYAHTVGGSVSSMATVQVFTALTAENMLQKGAGSFYLFGRSAPDWQKPQQVPPVTQPQQTVTQTLPSSQQSAASQTVSRIPDATQVTAVSGGLTGESAESSGTAAAADSTGETKAGSGSSGMTEQGTQTDFTTGTAASAQQNAVRTTAPAQPVRSDREKYPYRIPLTAAAAAVCGGSALIFVLRRQKSPKTYLTIGGAFCVLTVLVWVIRVESPEQFYTPEAHTGGGNVTMEIRCDVILGKPGSEAYPEDGVLMPLTEFSIEPEENALTLLYDAVKTYRIQIEVDGVSGDAVETAYVRGIASLYEFDFGDLSGWTYTVNGERPSVGCGSCILHDGDRVVWEYTVNL